MKQDLVADKSSDLAFLQGHDEIYRNFELRSDSGHGAECNSLNFVVDRVKGNGVVQTIILAGKEYQYCHGRDIGDIPADVVAFAWYNNNNGLEQGRYGIKLLGREAHQSRLYSRANSHGYVNSSSVVIRNG
jgi:hypothetical protein